jgi:hypothetical protein
MALADSIRRTIATVTKEKRDPFRDALIKLHARFRNTGTRRGVTYLLKHDEIDAGSFVYVCFAFSQWRSDLVIHYEAVLRQVDLDLSLRAWTGFRIRRFFSRLTSGAIKTPTLEACGRRPLGVQ